MRRVCACRTGRRVGTKRYSPTERCPLPEGDRIDYDVRVPPIPRGANIKLNPENSSIMQTTTAIFYHAGCPVCLEAEDAVKQFLDRTKVALEVVHLGSAKQRLAEAERTGVKSVPALVN